jgi:hypothetical protein
MLWKELFRDGANRALNKDAPLNSGEWCRWCPAKTICPKLSTEAFEEALIDFEPQTSALVTVNEPESLSVLTISNALLAAEKIETWIGALREHALYLAQSGAKIPKFKIVKKRSTRKWLDSENLGDKLVNSFGPECYEKKLVSPAQFEKRFKNDAGAAEVLRNFTVNESSGVTLVSESDPRPEYFEADHDFEDVITIERKECDVAKKTTKNTKTTKTTVIKKR